MLGRGDDRRKLAPARRRRPGRIQPAAGARGREDAAGNARRCLPPPSLARALRRPDNNSMNNACSRSPQPRGAIVITAHTQPECGLDPAQRCHELGGPAPPSGPGARGIRRHESRSAQEEAGEDLIGSSRSEGDNGVG